MMHLLARLPLGLLHALRLSARGAEQVDFLRYRPVLANDALKADFDTVMAALRDGRIDSTKLESEVLRLNDLPARFPDLVTNRDAIIKVIVDFSDAGAA